MPPTRFSIPSALALVGMCAFLGACEIEPPPPSLRMQMFRIDTAAKVIAGSYEHSSRFPAVAKSAREIVGLAEESAFARYEQKPSYPLPPNDLELFRSLRRNLLASAEELEQSALAGDEAAVAEAQTQLQALCTTCHGKFRPGL